MTTYIQRKSKFSGIQFTGDNRDKVIDALGIKKDYCQAWKNLDTDECYLIIRAPGCDLGKINISNWILIGLEHIEYFVCSAEQFKIEYEAIRTPIQDIIDNDFTVPTILSAKQIEAIAND